MTSARKVCLSIVVGIKGIAGIFPHEIERTCRFAYILHLNKTEDIAGKEQRFGDAHASACHQRMSKYRRSLWDEFVKF